MMTINLYSNDSSNVCIDQAFNKEQFYAMLIEYGFKINVINRAWAWVSVSDAWDGEYPIGQYTITLG